MISSKQKVLSGIQPTSRLTLGNYVGALRNWKEMQKVYQCFFCIVDLHALTARPDPAALREQTLILAATYLACGISPEESAIFIQSQISAHSELAWILNCYSYMGELQRMTQFKDKSAKEGANIPSGLFNYPVLMAADILLYQAHLVPVGADQKQHIELTRNLAERFNQLFGAVFTVPKPMIPPVGAKIMDLQNPTAKMSKSAEDDAGTIFLTDAPKIIEKKIKRAVTDSGSEIRADISQPGVYNLLEIQEALTGRSKDELVSSYAGKMYGHLKQDTAQIVIAAVEPIQEKITGYLQDRGEILNQLKKGRDVALPVAQKTLSEVSQAVGL